MALQEKPSTDDRSAVGTVDDPVGRAKEFQLEGKWPRPDFRGPMARTVDAAEKRHREAFQKEWLLFSVVINLVNLVVWCIYLFTRVFFNKLFLKMKFKKLWLINFFFDACLLFIIYNCPFVLTVQIVFTLRFAPHESNPVCIIRNPVTITLRLYTMSVKSMKPSKTSTDKFERLKLQAVGISVKMQLFAKVRI